MSEGELSPKSSLGNQGWWHILKYLILICDWPAVIGMLRPSVYRELQADARKWGNIK